MQTGTLPGIGNPKKMQLKMAIELKIYKPGVKENFHING